MKAIIMLSLLFFTTIAQGQGQSLDEFVWTGVTTATADSFAGLIAHSQLCAQEFDDSRVCTPGEIFTSIGNDNVLAIVTSGWNTASCTPSIFNPLRTVTVSKTVLFSPSISRIQPVACCAPIMGQPL